jgi:hypothetical protein
MQKSQTPQVYAPGSPYMQPNVAAPPGAQPVYGACGSTSSFAVRARLARASACTPAVALCGPRRVR